MRPVRTALLPALLLAVGCSRLLGFDDYHGRDGGVVDAAMDGGPADAGPDVGLLDGGPADSGIKDTSPPADACSTDAGCGECSPACADGVECIDGRCADEVVEVVLGQVFTCARQAGGTVQCWGDDRLGEIGRGVTSMSPRDPGLVVGIEHASALTAGSGYACVLLNPASPEGVLKCWGSNDRRQLGTMLSSTAEPTPVPPDPFVTDARAVTAGTAHTCYFDMDGHVHCAGDNSSYQIGRSPLGGTFGFTGVAIPTSGPVVALDAGTTHTCALAGGQVMCWGANNRGQLGRDTAGGPTPTPQPAAGLREANALGIGGTSSCAIVAGEAHCWGLNAFGQLGDGTTDSRLMPMRVMALPTPVTRIAISDTHACAIAADHLYCWGSNANGQVGIGSTGGIVTIPIRIDSIAAATSVAVAQDHTCAVTADGRVLCWGSNISGQIRPPADTPRVYNLPVEVTLAPLP